MASATTKLSSEDTIEHFAEILYSCGSNGSGQLGIGHREDVSQPMVTRNHCTSSPARIVNVACGGNHTVVLYSNGQVATAGDNSDGRCLGRSEKDGTEFTLVSTRSNLPGSAAVSVQGIAATWSSTLLVTRNHQVLTCGTGMSGELGLGRGKETALVPTIIENFPPPGTYVVNAASCMGHTVAVLSNGEAWGWGKGRQGQLGFPLENRWQPSKIEGIPFFACDVVCGKDFTCIFGHSSEGQLHMFGPSGRDRFGVKANAPQSLPAWKQVAGSWGSVFVLLETGYLIAWGRNDHGQLPPKDLPLLSSIAAGSEHCIGLVAGSAKVFAWGWGEHGNCGSYTDSNGNVNGVWNELQTPHPPTTVFAGCATSFVVAPKSFHSEG